MQNNSVQPTTTFPAVPQDDVQSTPLPSGAPNITINTNVGGNATPSDTTTPSSTPVSSDGGGIGSQPKRKVNGKVLATIFGLVLLVGGVGAGLLLVQQQQVINQNASTTTSINDVLTVTQSDVNSCGSKCTDQLTCGMYVNVYSCSSNTAAGGCQDNLIASNPSVNVGDHFGFNTGISCGTQQIDLGCKDKNGTYGNLQFLSYSAPTSCNNPPSPTGTGTPTNSCSGACFAPGSTYTDSNGNTVTVTNCGSVGRTGVSGTCSDSSDLCCGFVGGGNPPPISCTATFTSKAPFDQPVQPGRTGTFQLVIQNDREGLGSAGSFVAVHISSTNNQVATVTPTLISVPEDLLHKTYLLTGHAVGVGTAKFVATVDMKPCPACATVTNKCNVDMPIRVVISSTTSPSPTATATAGTAPQCTGIKIYDENFDEIPSSEWSSLTAGTQIKIAVTGTTPAGNFDKARFFVNDAVNPIGESSSTVPSNSSEYYIDYTIPSGVTSFTISGELHQAQLDQWI